MWSCLSSRSATKVAKILSMPQCCFGISVLPFKIRTSFSLALLVAVVSNKASLWCFLCLNVYGKTMSSSLFLEEAFYFSLLLFVLLFGKASHSSSILFEPLLALSSSDIFCSSRNIYVFLYFDKSSDNLALKALLLLSLLLIFFLLGKSWVARKIAL